MYTSKGQRKAETKKDALAETALKQQEQFPEFLEYSTRNLVVFSEVDTTLVKCGTTPYQLDKP